MSENKTEYLTVARDFLIIGEKENAYIHYAKVAQDDPENAEAAFFGAYLGYKSLLDENDYASAVNAFKAMSACLKDAVKHIKSAELEEIGKHMILAELVECYMPITRYLFTNRISTTTGTIETGVLGLYALGDAIKNEFGNDAENLKLSVAVWKEGVALQSQFYAYKYNGVKPEDYVTEIQKVEPTYTMPKKAGCISIGG